jgi:hypothetical protein
MELAHGRIHEIPDRIMMLDNPAQTAIPATAIKVFRAAFRLGKQSARHEHLHCLADSPRSPLSPDRRPPWFEVLAEFRSSGSRYWVPPLGERHANEDVEFAPISRMESVGEIISIKLNKNYCRNK